MTQSDAIDAAALMQGALAALAKGDGAAASSLIAQVIDAKRVDAGVWLAMAQARGLLNDHAGKTAALNAAASLAPNDLRVLLAKGDHLTEAGDPRAASAFYNAALQYMPRYHSLPQNLKDGLRRAQEANARVVRELEEHVRASLAAKDFGDGRAPARVATALDLLFGKKRAYVQEPRYLYWPDLPQIQFYERFPWMDSVEAAFEEARAELCSVIDGDFEPYVTQAEDRPMQAQGGLANNPDWSALFLRKNGADEPWAARCPTIMAALKDAPLTSIPKRAPSVLFSKLAAGAHIPPHTGMLNARLICHLPLIVPDGCEFRVGNDLRRWSEGKVWAFDDTIEHEAWNRSAQDRYILIFDIWRPELNEGERAGVAALCEAIDAYRGATPWDA